MRSKNGHQLIIMHTPCPTPWVDNRWNLFLYLAVSFKGGKILPGWYENLWRPVGFTTKFLKGILRWVSKEHTCRFYGCFERYSSEIYN